MATELLLALWEGLLASSAGCLVVLLLRRRWARLFGAGSTPLLWSLVPLALLAVWLPAPTQPLQSEWGLLPATREAVAAAIATPTVGNEAGQSFDLRLLLFPWAVGALLAAAYFFAQQRHFRRRLGRLQQLPDGSLRAERNDVGPAVLGVLRPRIVLPADFHTRYSTEEQALILAHERSHLRRGDVLANAVATTLRALYWFNPLLHYAANRLRHDHELASDAEVVQRYPHARRRYADTLLNVQLAVPGLPVGCLWQSSHPLKERILMLSTSRSTPRRRTLGTALATALSLSAAAVAWASQPATASAEEPVATPSAEADRGPSYRQLAPPTYPAQAVTARQAGNVLLRVLVDADGAANKVEVETSSGVPTLDESAVAAASRWRFNPAIKDGAPVEQWVLVPVCFSLDSEAQCEAPEGALEGIYRLPPQPKPQG